MGAACNEFGTIELDDNTCKCKPGFTGSQCEDCSIYNSKYYIGNVNNVTGEGMRCLGLGKFKQRIEDGAIMLIIQKSFSMNFTLSCYRSVAEHIIICWRLQ